MSYQVRLWRLGVFTLHVVPFVNYGLLDGDIVLLDDGSLTDDPLLIRRALSASELTLDHIEETLRAHVPGARGALSRRIGPGSRGQLRAAPLADPGGS